MLIMLVAKLHSVSIPMKATAKYNEPLVVWDATSIACCTAHTAIRLRATSSNPIEAFIAA